MSIKTILHIEQVACLGVLTDGLVADINRPHKLNALSLICIFMTCPVGRNDSKGSHDIYDVAPDIPSVLGF